MSSNPKSPLIFDLKFTFIANTAGEPPRRFQYVVDQEGGHISDILPESGGGLQPPPCNSESSLVKERLIDLVRSAKCDQTPKATGWGS